MTEQDLVELCKSGDRRALKLLYDRYATWMMGISMRYVGNEEDSRDILHDSFVKIFRSIDSFEYRGVGSLSAWLSRIVINNALAFLKKEQNLLQMHEDILSIDIHDNMMSDEDDTDLYAAVSDEIIIYCVGKLPKRLRMVFNLFMFEDMPHCDIAKELGISESASRVRLHRAKALMAEAITEQIKRMER